MVSTLRAGLEEAGHEVITALDAEEGFRAAVTSMPDVVTLDFQMPKGNGTEMLKRLREHKVLSVVPVIFVSSMPRKTLGTILKDDPLTRFLAKPVDMKALRKAVSELAGRGGLPGPDVPRPG